MTIRNLFNIILKILGIFFIKDILGAIPQLLSISEYMVSSQTSGVGFTLLATILMLLIYTLISYYLVFRTNLIIDKLKLDQGFDQDIIPMDVHRSTILSVAIIVIGGLMVAEEIPNLCRQLFVYFQEKRLTGESHQGLSYSVLAAAKIVVGMLLIGYQRRIVDYIEGE